MDSLPNDYTYAYGEIMSSNLVITFKVKEIVDQSSAMEWLMKWSDITHVTWRLLRTYPNSGRKNLYKIDLRCQHSTDKRARGVRSSKNTDCPAKMSITIRRFLEKTKSTKEQDPTIREFPTVIILKEEHNHCLKSEAVLKYRELSLEVKQKFFELFQQGHNPSSALHLHKIDLMMQHDEANYYRIAADGKFLPSISIVNKLFEKEFQICYGNPSDESFSHLDNLLREYTKNNPNAKVGFNYTSDQEHYFVVLCTPIMLRIHEKIIQTSEVVMIDASGGVDKQRHRIYFLVTPTAAGGLPLGVIITDSEKQMVFFEALKYFKDLIGNCAFNYKLFPNIFITDNDLKEINAIEKVFPKSKTLLCQFHMLKSVWSWLCDSKHNIQKEDRQEIYFMFKNVLYSYSIDSFNEAFSKLISFTIMKSYRKLNKHLNNLAKNKEKWASYFRNSLPLRGNNTTNYIEVVFRVLKDCILNRTMAFNLTQLVDFILTRYEFYLQQRLTDFANGRYSTSLLKKMIPFKMTKTDLFLVERQFDTDVYNVMNSNEKHVVDIVRGICSCKTGSSGKLCKHSSAVILSLEDDIRTAYNLVCTNTKRDILYVASGVLPSLEWFLPIGETVDSLKPTTFKPYKNNDTIAYSDNKCEEDLQESHDNINSYTLSKGEIQQLDNIFCRIQNGCKSNPSIFVPAVKKMLKNAVNFTNTESGLISALYTFGTYSGLPSSVENNNKNIRTKRRRSHKTKIGVQPTAIGRRKYCLTGKRKVSAGRPSGQKRIPDALNLHNYTSFGYLPLRKRKAPHCLETCVFDNKSLGMTKHAKT